MAGSSVFHWKMLVCLRRGFGVFLPFAVAVFAQGPPSWSGFGRDAQHTALSSVAAQRLERIKWSTSVDLTPTVTGGDLLTHYGSPVATAGNTILVPVRTSPGDTFRVEARSGANGSLKYALTTDYSPPPHDWTPPYGIALSMGSRLYYPGAGGTVYYRDQPDSTTGASGQIAFYGNALYNSNRADFDGVVTISTPLVADSSGNIFFGFQALGSNPANLVNGVARISSSGAGSWIAASRAGGDPAILETPLNSAPALSRDELTLYFAVSEGDGGGGYLVSVDSRTLAPIARIRLKDPQFGTDALLLDNSSASPVIAPDGDVYYGVFESMCCANDERGWLLHFDASLAQSKIPGAFGWDTTPSIVPANAVASYGGPSAYLIFTKYNNYANVGPGGNGDNRIAVLDPNVSMTDPITGIFAMNEVLSIRGATPAPEEGIEGAVREWCINSAAVDPFTKAVVANSEDGVVYRWDLTTNTLVQQVRLTPGLGEAYTPNLIGPDGTAYAISDAVLFAVGQASNLTITGTHNGAFRQGQHGAGYVLTVTNSGLGPSRGIVTVIDVVPAGLTASGVSGTGWACVEPSGPCVRSDPLLPGAAYPPITLSVNVAANAGAVITNTVSVSADGAPNTINSTSSDVTQIAASMAITAPDSLPPGVVGAAYAPTTVTASGGSGTYTWSATGLPPGLAINSKTGVISGVPASNAGSPFQVQVTAADSTGASASRLYSLTVISAGCVFSTNPSSVTVGNGSGTFVSLSGVFTLNATNCSASDVWTVQSTASWLTITSASSGNGSLPSVTIGFSAFTNTTTRARSANILVAGRTFTVNQTGSTENQLQRVVRALYQTVLGREPDSAGFQFWTGPGAPRDSNAAVLVNQMADDFYRSAEFRAAGWETLEIYQAVLGRLLTLAEWQSAVTRIRAGAGSASDLLNALASAAGLLADSAFVQTTVQNAYNRPATPAEISAYTAQLTASQSPNPRLDLLNNTIFQSSEFQRLTNPEFLQMLYFTILVRDPDPAGFSFWVDMATNTPGQPGIYYVTPSVPPAAAYATKLAIIGQAVPPNPSLLGFLGSPEFQNLIQ